MELYSRVPEPARSTNLARMQDIGVPLMENIVLDRKWCMLLHHILRKCLQGILYKYCFLPGPRTLQECMIDKSIPVTIEIDK